MLFLSFWKEPITSIDKNGDHTLTENYHLISLPCSKAAEQHCWKSVHCCQPTCLSSWVFLRARLHFCYLSYSLTPPSLTNLWRFFWWIHILFLFFLFFLCIKWFTPVPLLFIFCQHPSWPLYDDVSSVTLPIYFASLLLNLYTAAPELALNISKRPSVSHPLKSPPTLFPTLLSPFFIISELHQRHQCNLCW